MSDPSFRERGARQQRGRHARVIGRLSWRITENVIHSDSEEEHYSLSIKTYCAMNLMKGHRSGEEPGEKEIDAQFKTVPSRHPLSARGWRCLLIGNILVQGRQQL